MGHHPIQSKGSLGLLDNVREICMELPEVTEAVDSFGHTSFRIKDKPFVMLGEHDGDLSISIKVLPETQNLLLQQEGYTKTSYIGQHGWTSAGLTDQTDWDVIGELIVEGYYRTAPNRILNQLKARIES